MISLTEQKYHLFQLISSINNPGILMWLEKELLKKQEELSPTSNGQSHRAEDELSKKLKRPLRKKLDPESLKKAQGWQGHDEAALIKAIHELAIEEPIEELLAQLTA